LLLSPPLAVLLRSLLSHFLHPYPVAGSLASLTVFLPEGGREGGGGGMAGRKKRGEEEGRTEGERSSTSPLLE
jgi:hypothetical protein